MAETASSGNEKRTSLFGFIVNAIMIILLSLLISILVEWIGMVFIWEEQGSMHSLNMLAEEMTYVNKDFSHGNHLGYRPVDVVSYFYDSLYKSSDGTDVLSGAINWLNEPNTSQTGTVEEIVRFGGNSIKEFALSAMYITMIFTIRLSILILSLPLFFVVAVLAVIDGLAKRDVRRWSNGRESGFRYHYAKKWVVISFFVVWMVYLSLPFSIHPNFVVLPLILMMGWIIREAVSWFKKYL